MTRIALTILLGIAMLVTATASLSSQTPPKPSFQVASIKANAHSGFSPTTRRVAGNRFSVTGMPLFPLVMDAYNLRDWQIIGGPAWINIDQWDIEAVAGEGVDLQVFDLQNPSRPTLAALMVQSLVENRFQF